MTKKLFNFFTVNDGVLAGSMEHGKQHAVGAFTQFYRDALQEAPLFRVDQTGIDLFEGSLKQLSAEANKNFLGNNTLWQYFRHYRYESSIVRLFMPKVIKLDNVYASFVAKRDAACTVSIRLASPLIMDSPNRWSLRLTLYFTKLSDYFLVWDLIKFLDNKSTFLRGNGTGVLLTALKENFSHSFSHLAPSVSYIDKIHIGNQLKKVAEKN